MSPRITVQQIADKKKRGEKITMLTAYDFPMASLIDQAGIDIILVGDSLANVVLGLDSTTLVNMPEMLHHAKAVTRAVKNALVIGDMPYDSYQADPEHAVSNARRFIKEAGCQAVKLEWFKQCPHVAEKIIKAGIPVMGHVGLTPQTVDPDEGFKVQGRDAESALQILENAKILEEVGCFSIVIECVPHQVAKMITEQLSIPTIGIGSGKYCDGQVLVTYDLLGLFHQFHPRFAKTYTDLSKQILKAVSRYKQDVKQSKFPAKKHSFKMDPQELKSLREATS